MNTVNTSHKKSKKNFVVAGFCIVLFLTLVFAFGSAPEVSAVLTGQTNTLGNYKTLSSDDTLGSLGITEADVKDLPKLLTTVFRLMLGAAAALSVLMITLGGIEYLSTDIIFKKEEGRKKIENALWGLALAISAYLILYTINPKTLEFNFNVEPPPPIPSNSNSQGNENTENDPCPPGQVRVSLPDRTTECRDQ